MKRFNLLWIVTLVTCAAMGQSLTLPTMFKGPSYESTCDVRELMNIPAAEAKARKVRLKAEEQTEEEVVRFIDRITNMPSYYHDFYSRLKTDIHNVLDGETTALSDPQKCEVISGEVCAYKVYTYSGSTDFTFESWESIAQDAYNAVKDIMKDQWDEYTSFIPYVCLSVNMDLPEAFWLDSRFSFMNSSSYHIAEYDLEKKTGKVFYENNMLFCVKAPNHDLRRTEFQTVEDIESGIERYQAAVDSILKYFPEDSCRYDQVCYLNDWLTLHNCYNILSQDKLPTLAWSPLSALEGTVGDNSPVCEGYARALKVLCDQKRIPCVLVTGQAQPGRYESGEAHMWNYVKMEDDTWYAVDPTWNDPRTTKQEAVSGKETHRWLLLGSETLIDDNFTFIQSHPENPQGGFQPNGPIGWELVPGPAIGEQAYDEDANEFKPEPGPEPEPELIKIKDITDLITKYLLQTVPSNNENGENNEEQEENGEGNGEE